MKINLFNMDTFINTNKCPEVINPIYIDNNKHPTSNGLFSNELFGLPGSYDRKSIFGYVNLGKHFLHPVVYIAMIRMDRRIQYVIEGSKYFVIENGELIENNENGETGLSFLYNNWDKLNYKKNTSRQRANKIDMLSYLKKDEIFCNKWLIIPAFYRDLDFSKSSSGKIGKDAVNDLYVRLINLATTLSNSRGFDFMGNITEYKIQSTLVDIYTYLTKPLAKKTGYIRKNLMGKSIDYSYRSVLSAPRIGDQRDWSKKEKVDFAHTGVPLGQMCALFLPFVIKEIRDFLSDRFTSVNYMMTTSKKKIFLKHPMDDFTDNKIEKLIQLYLSSTEHRFDILKVNTEEGYKPCKIYYNDLGHDFTLTDLLYICAYKVSVNKHIYVTRYPVESYCVQR